MLDHPLPKGILVWLDKHEMFECQHAAANRWRYARSTGIENKRADGSRSDNDVDVLGIKGEVAVAKLLGLSYDRIFTVGTDDGSDLNFKGITIDVKSTFHEGGRLLLRRELRSEVAVLVVPTKDDNVMRVVGYTDAKHYERHKVVDSIGGKPTECLRQDALLPIDMLWSMGVKRAG